MIIPFLAFRKMWKCTLSYRDVGTKQRKPPRPKTGSGHNNGAYVRHIWFQFLSWGKMLFCCGAQLWDRRVLDAPTASSGQRMR